MVTNVTVADHLITEYFQPQVVYIVHFVLLYVYTVLSNNDNEL